MRKKAANNARQRVAVLACDGLSPFEFGVACEVFGYDRSDLGVAWYDMVVCARRPGVVRTGLGFGIEAAGGLQQLGEADLVVVAPFETAETAAVEDEVAESLWTAHLRGARVASLCTGAFVLARAGLLDGRRVTTHWSSAAELAAGFPAVTVDPRVLYIDDGDVLTSAGSAASIDLCLHIVRGDFGADIANTVARRLVVPPHRDGDQAQFVDMPVPAHDEDDLLADTLHWARQHLDDPLTVEQLAEHCVMSPRTFARRFRAVTGTTPHRWLVRQRVAFAQRLLETTNWTVDHIASVSGLGTAANLRLQLASVAGVSPGSYRRTFRGNPAA